jgi:hypothetical protein
MKLEIMLHPMSPLKRVARGMRFGNTKLAGIGE